MPLVDHDSVSLIADQGIACTGTEEVTKTFRFVASCFSDVPSYERDLLVSEVSEDVAYTVAIRVLP